MPRKHFFFPRTREQALTLWSFVGTVLAAVAGWVGGGYALDGNKIAPGENYHVLEHAVPGGMHTVGVVMLLMCFAMVYCVLTPFTRSSKWLLRVFAGVAFLVALSFAASWLTTGQVSWGGPFLWAGVGALAEGMVIFPPDSLPIGEDPPDAPGTVDLGGRRSDSLHE